MLKPMSLPPLRHAGDYRTEHARNVAMFIASQWHSVMTWNDPGVTMYALSSTGSVQTPQHRVNLIAYIEGHCLDMVRSRANCATRHPDDRAVDEEDKEQLEWLLDYVNMVPLSAPGEPLRRRA